MEHLIFFIILVAIGYFAGSLAESKHFKSIREREEELFDFPAVNVVDIFEESDVIENIYLVSGSAVISLDYFKRVLAALRHIFGGRVAAYESLIDRARREALIRMKADAEGSDAVVNVRIETSPIGQNAENRNVVGSIEALAYGTAVVLRK